jgi:hypothetical protein
MGGRAALIEKMVEEVGKQVVPLHVVLIYHITKLPVLPHRSSSSCEVDSFPAFSSKLNISYQWCESRYDEPTMKPSDVLGILRPPRIEVTSVSLIFGGNHTCRAHTVLLPFWLSFSEYGWMYADLWGL